MAHDAGATAVAALVLSAALMKHLVREGVIQDEFKQVFEDAAASLSGNPKEQEIIAILNAMVRKP